jgi:CPA1 family monovalent cation:H+ antiporter
LLSLFDLIAALVTTTAAFAWINRRFLRLPANVGLLIMGLVASLLLLGIEMLIPATELYQASTRAIRQIDFYDTFMNGMLALLLFVGALSVDLGRLRSRAPVVIVLATVGVLISTAIVAIGLWLVALAVGLPLSFEWALVFGAIVAPTDPVAVLATLKSTAVPASLKTDMSGEALFNDGFGVVLFTVALQAALEPGGDLSPLTLLRELVLQAGGGLLLGLATGYLAYRAIRAIDDYSLEVLISIALVTGTYALANDLGMSGPIAVVVAGVLIGNRGAEYAMSDISKRYMYSFWTLLDQILNSVLFLLIGLEVLVLNFDLSFLWMALIAVPLVVLARSVSVAGPVMLLSFWRPFARGTIPVLIWGGVRGGISIALALALPYSPERTLILSATYAVVLFTIVVQGLTFGIVLRRTAARPQPASTSA